MIIYPAIDIRQGRVVRLHQGDPAQETVHAADPLEVAQRWRAGGAAWIHVINLDGAFGEAVTALETLRKLAGVGLPVQFGGGLRSLDDAAAALEAGAARVILGTLAVQQPDAVKNAIQQWGAEAVCVALDARDGRVATHGWQQASEWDPVELGRHFAGMGLKHALYTDISRDGALSGVNVAATARLAREAGLSVQASGGVAALNDVRAVRAAGDIAGVVIGKALYTGAFTLAEALQVAQMETENGE